MSDITYLAVFYSEHSFIKYKMTLAFHSNSNLLIEGENRAVLKALLENGFANKIDLVYIDPPFATGNVFRKGKRAATMSCTENDEIAYSDEITGEAFIDFLHERIVLLRELLIDTGSLYLHIDYKIGHYVKIMLDGIFGVKNFRNDITRMKCNPKNFNRLGYGNCKDMILFYTKTDSFIWNEPFVKRDEEDFIKLFPLIDSQGRRYTTNPLHAPGETKNGATGQSWRGMQPPEGRHWRCPPAELDVLDSQGLIHWSNTGNPRKIIYADDYDKKRMQDIWDFKDPQHPLYPTQKNSDMLELIIRTSSNTDSCVLDCFCGSGTTLLASQNLGRRWLGVDESAAAIAVCKERLGNGGLFETYKYVNFV